MLGISLFLLNSIIAEGDFYSEPSRVVSGTTQSVYDVNNKLIDSRVNSITLSPCTFSVMKNVSSDVPLELNVSGRVFFVQNITVQQLNEKECVLNLGNDNPEKNVNAH